MEDAQTGRQKGIWGHGVVYISQSAVQCRMSMHDLFTVRASTVHCAQQFISMYQVWYKVVRVQFSRSGLNGQAQAAEKRRYFEVLLSVSSLMSKRDFLCFDRRVSRVSVRRQCGTMLSVARSDRPGGQLPSVHNNKTGNLNSNSQQLLKL